MVNRLLFRLLLAVLCCGVLDSAAFAAERGLLREVYLNVQGGTVDALREHPNFPDNPDRTEFMADFEAPVDEDNNYGQRVRGYILPPATGDYVFWISSDDFSELYLSTDSVPARKRLIASVPGWTASREWNKYGEQQSEPIRLEQGRPYYVEALMAEGGGGDHLAVMWDMPGNLPIEEPIPNERLVPWGATLGPPQISEQPSSQTVAEGRSVTFRVLVSNFDEMRYQWHKDNVPISGATAAEYTIPAAELASNGSKYHVTLTNSAGSATSTQATLTVTPDTAAPMVVEVTNLGTNQVRVLFSERVESASATTLQNYSANNGVVIHGAMLSGDGMSVTLTVTGLSFDQLYSLTVRGVRDIAQNANTITETAVNFLARRFIAGDVGAPSPAGTFSFYNNSLALTSGGRGIGGTSDSHTFQYIQVTGDFDYQVQIESLTSADTWTKAALLARVSLAGNSAMAAAVATPSLAGSFYQARASSSATAIQTGSARMNYPLHWLRLRRVGSQYTGYVSVDGSNWAQLGSSVVTSSATMYVGMAISSGKEGAAATGTFRNFAPTTGAAIIPEIAFRNEPPGPSSRRTGLVLSEIMYHPMDRSDGRNIEFIEVFNSQSIPEDISGFSLAGDISFTFPAGTIIPGGGFVVVAKDPAGLAAVYSNMPAAVLGPFDGNLSNGGGLVLLRNRINAHLLEVEYSDKYPWPASADGGGHSLVLTRPSYGERNEKAWGPSERIGGSPGMVDAYVPTPLSAVVINEFLAHTDDPDRDFIELFNTSEAAVNISGCVLTDDAGLLKFEIPPNTILEPLGHIAFTEDDLGFSLSAAGESIFFYNAQRSRVLDAVTYEGQENGVSFGRTPSGGPVLSALANSTSGAANAGKKLENVVINEIMFNPISRDDDDEFIELHNRGSRSVDLAGWRFTKGVDFAFPSGATIAAGGYVVVARNADRIKSNHPTLNSALVYGNYSGSLANSGERLTLSKPDQTVTTNATGQVLTETIHIIVNEVAYGEGGRWGEWADGGGSSLELIDPRADNSLAPNWGDSDETTKGEWTLVEHTGVLDNGRNTANEVHVMMLGGGEMLVDNIEVVSGGVNRVSNGTFESGLTGWGIQGNHVRSSQGTTGYNSARSLHIRATSGGDNGANRIESNLSANINSGVTATIRARARWLRGDPLLLIRLYGNWLEASGTLTPPKNLGTPGARNSVFAANNAPAIYDVSHFPVMPALGRSVRVTARVADPDGVSQATLRYRNESTSTFTSATMNDNGTGADLVAGDGLFSANIPGANTASLYAFYVTATDSASQSATFPEEITNQELLVRFGDSVPNSTFPTYRLLITSANINRWSSRERLSNEPLDGTFVYGDFRAIYNAAGRYRGSPWIRPGYDSPVGGLCAYVFTLPDDDALFAETELNLDSLEPGKDPTRQRERTSFWIADQLNVEFSHQRYIQLYINGSRRGDVYSDSQQPNSDYISSWHPENDEGEIFKIDDWFEFNDAVGQEFNVNARLENYTTTGGAKKTARYRWSWERKSNRGIDDDYSSLFALVDALNNPGTGYVAAVDSIVNYEQWTRVFAARHIVGDWDGYGYNRGKNQFTYRPDGGKFHMLLWDLDFSLGGGSDGATTSMFNVDDPVIGRFYSEPTFARAYYRAMRDAVDGPLLASNVDPVMDATYAAFLNNGITDMSSPNTVKSWIQSRRNYLLGVLNGVNANFNVTQNSVTTNRNLVTLTGTAPITVKDIEVNGVPYPVTWPTVTTWQMSVPVSNASNPLTVIARDLRQNEVGRDTLTVTYTGALPQPIGSVMISEIMYNPAVPGTSFIELHNASTTHTFDLSNWELSGASFVFPEGVILAPNAYLVIVANNAAFREQYGLGPRVVGEFAGTLQNDGETLRLLRPGAAVGTVEEVDVVRYEGTAPWPVAANGSGPSLQMIDRTQDNFSPANWAVAGVGQALSTPAAANSVARSLVALPDIWINEVQPQNLTGGMDNAGERESWIELYNASSTGMNLSGYTLTTNVANPGLWMFPNGFTIAARSFAVIWADGEVSESTAAAPHTNFKLTPGSGTVAFGRAENSTTVILDYVNYNGVTADRSLGSVPDGAGSRRQSFFFPTPGASNNPASGPAQVFINEWMAANSRTYADLADGNYEDWIELFNAADEPVDLSGFFLTDNLLDKTKYRIPNGVVIPAKGFLIAWADEEMEQFGLVNNNLHVNFKLGAGGEAIGLYTPEGIVVDSLTFGEQDDDVSQGRHGDGAPAPFRFFTSTTPGAPNIATQPVNTAPEITAIAPITIDAGQTASFQVIAIDRDQPPQTLAYSLVNAPAGATIQPQTGAFTWAVPANWNIASNPITIVVADNGSPTLSAQTVATVNVTPGTHPAMNISASVNPTTGVMTLTWAAQAGRTYNVQTRDALNDGSWTDLQPITATSETASLSIDTRAKPTAYYRIQLAP